MTGGATERSHDGASDRRDAHRLGGQGPVHWGYGTGWGAVRGIIGAVGLDAVGATVAHTALVYATEQVTLPALDVDPTATEWGRPEEVAIDAWHHLVYGLATGAAYELLDGQRT